MSKHESWRTRHYWQSIGGLLIEEFLVVPRSSKEGIARRLIDGVIVLDEEPACQVGGEFEIRGRDVICVPTKTQIETTVKPHHILNDFRR
jgi:hypothetical protein